jgi:hypothetical protein
MIIAFSVSGESMACDFKLDSYLNGLSNKQPINKSIESYSVPECAKKNPKSRGDSGGTEYEVNGLNIYMEERPYGKENLSSIRVRPKSGKTFKYVILIAKAGIVKKMKYK